MLVHGFISGQVSEYIPVSLRSLECFLGKEKTEMFTTEFVDYVNLVFFLIIIKFAFNLNILNKKFMFVCNLSKDDFFLSIINPHVNLFYMVMIFGARYGNLLSY